MNKSVLTGAVLATTLATTLATAASAQVSTFGGTSPTGNYSAFVASLSSLGGIPTTVDFNSLSSGPFSGAVLPGVTVTANGTGATTASGAGPGQPNNTATPVSSGEGLHAASGYIQLASPGSGPNGLTFNFDSPTFGAGLFVIDYYQPTLGGVNNPLLLQAFAGASGTGSLVGSVTAVRYNFQMNNQLFLGITSGAGDIGSLVFTRSTDNSSDVIGIDNLTFAAATTVPEPGTWALLGTGLLAVGGVAARRKRTTV
jgi:hypothetical protein